MWESLLPRGVQTSQQRVKGAKITIRRGEQREKDNKSPVVGREFLIDARVYTKIYQNSLKKLSSDKNDLGLILSMVTKAFFVSHYFNRKLRDNESFPLSSVS